MKAVVQRVTRACVRVDGEVVGSVGKGLLVLLGVAQGDPQGCEELLARKVVDLRIFPDADDKMNLAVGEVGGGLLVVSQFTLLAECKKGRRPSFISAAPPEEANQRYERFCALARAQGLEVQTGRFGASMEVELINDGPVTIVLDTRELLS